VVNKIATASSVVFLVCTDCSAVCLFKLLVVHLENINCVTSPHMIDSAITTATDKPAAASLTDQNTRSDIIAERLRSFDFVASDKLVKNN